MNEARKISFLIVFDSLMQNESSLLAFQIKFRPFNSFQTEIEGRYERRKVIAGDDLGRNCSPPQLLLNVIMDIRQEVKDYEDYRIAFCRLVALCRGSHYFCNDYLLTHSLTHLPTYLRLRGRLLEDPWNDTPVSDIGGIECSLTRNSGLYFFYKLSLEAFD